MSGGPCKGPSSRASCRRGGTWWGQHRGSPSKRGHCLGYPKALLGHLPALGAPGREPHPEECPQSRGDITALLREPPKHWELRGHTKSPGGGQTSNARGPKSHPAGSPQSTGTAGGIPQNHPGGDPQGTCTAQGMPQRHRGGEPPRQGGPKATREGDPQTTGTAGHSGEAPKSRRTPQSQPGVSPKPRNLLGVHSTPGQGGCLWGIPLPEPLPPPRAALTCPWRAGSCPPRCGWRERSAGPWRAGGRSGAEGAERGLEPADPQPRHPPHHVTGGAGASQRPGGGAGAASPAAIGRFCPLPD